MEVETNDGTSFSDVVMQYETIGTRESEQRFNSSSSALLPLIKIDKKQILGQGGYGIVYKGLWGEEAVAVKRIQSANTESNEKEEEALKSLNHPNVIKLLDVEVDKDFRYYVLELCQLSLHQLFWGDKNQKKCREKMPSDKEVFLQLAMGLAHIHEMRLIHRDLKPENVLIWVDSTGETVLMKWADFGLSKPVSERGSCSMSGPNRGSNNWYAPEILKMKIDEEENRTTPLHRQRGTVISDVFTEGLIFAFYLLEGLHPFGSPLKIPSYILKDKPVNLLKEENHQLIHKIIMEMLKHNPGDRISSSQVVEKIKTLP
ncbi:serine/threonine-protein kinase/endoribonuclease IRE1-like isoform X2 [Daphnia pulicaria]|uniref:serine/threonine-protein kinase/endoribonuclease IRE1-like isoform X2 n=1 Tax=Daphnia pulicaria TaxID=35523 RepID=UPI001EEA5A6F|nr:serine/threonine-protein kinase/endoribonuclease IRE1-like isoform X2 [Daphnia pulicaria]